MKKRLRVAKEVAQGMQCLHSCNPPIIHCNLKSSNVLVSESFGYAIHLQFSEKWHPKVSDFFLGNRLSKEQSKISTGAETESSFGKEEVDKITERRYTFSKDPPVPSRKSSTSNELQVRVLKD